jgi:hypothetical protein
MTLSASGGCQGNGQIKVRQFNIRDVISWGKEFDSHRKQGNRRAKILMWDLLIHGQDREQNFVKFFVKLCATGTPNAPVRSCYSIENTCAPAFMNRLLSEYL